MLNKYILNMSTLLKISNSQILFVGICLGNNYYLHRGEGKSSEKEFKLGCLLKLISFMYVCHQNLYLYTLPFHPLTVFTVRIYWPLFMSLKLHTFTWTCIALLCIYIKPPLVNDDINLLQEQLWVIWTGRKITSSRTHHLWLLQTSLYHLLIFKF